MKKLRFSPNTFIKKPINHHELKKYRRGKCFGYTYPVLNPRIGLKVTSKIIVNRKNKVFTIKKGGDLLFMIKWYKMMLETPHP